MDLDLSGKAALVTGGGRGIGRAIALELAGLGAAVAVNYRSRASEADATVGEIEAGGGKALAVQADVSDPAGAASAVDATVRQFGAIHILVNNAGLTRDNLILRMKDEDWHEVIEVDLSGAFYTSRAAVKQMLRQRWGRIINIASIAGVSGNAGQANYSAAKAGLIGLTRSLAREVGSRSITVNAVAPGFIDTEMTASLSDEIKDRVRQLASLQRTGTAQEVAAAVGFLASPASSYVTGQVLIVDGGLST